MQHDKFLTMDNEEPVDVSGALRAMQTIASLPLCFHDAADFLFVPVVQHTNSSTLGPRLFPMMQALHGPAASAPHHASAWFGCE